MSPEKYFALKLDSHVEVEDSDSPPRESTADEKEAIELDQQA